MEHVNAAVRESAQMLCHWGSPAGPPCAFLCPEERIQRYEPASQARLDIGDSGRVEKVVTADKSSKSFCFTGVWGRPLEDVAQVLTLKARWLELQTDFQK